MKRTSTTVFLLLFALMCLAQDGRPIITLKWAPTGLILGSASLQAEYSFGDKNSLTAKIGLPVTVSHHVNFQEKDARFAMQATSFLAGYRTYFSDRHLRGLYFEPFFNYVHHHSEGIGKGTLSNRTVTFELMNDYSGAGLGAQLGYQFFIGKKIVFDLFFLGPELNSSRNSLKATEITNTIAWNHIEAAEAEQQIRDFLNQFPFIKNRVQVMVDPDNRKVNAEFKGLLPGFRTGASIGIAF